MLRTVEAIIDALGGTTAAADMAGVGKAAVSNWKQAQRIPPEYYVALQAALEQQGERADPKAFGMK